MRQYMEIAPSPLLDKYVQNYWIMDTHEMVTEDTICVLPDGCFDLVIDIEHGSNNSIVLTGVWDEMVSVDIYPGRQTVGVRFFPKALDAFFSCPVAKIRNKVTPFFSGMLRGDGRFFLESLQVTKDVDELVEILDEYFVLTAVTGNNGINGGPIPALDSYSTVEAVAEDIGISRRHLSRLYQARFGISPKTYMRIVRFIRAKEMLESDPQSNLAEVAASCDYYDQAHFIKDFRRFSGLTPKAFAEKKLSAFYN